MNFAENFRIALRALAANKLRSALTMLGIIIGVGAVVALMAIGNGATATISSQVQGIGSNLVTVFPGSFERGRQPALSYLYLSDSDALLKSLHGVNVTAPTYNGSAETVSYRAQRLALQSACTHP